MYSSHEIEISVRRIRCAMARRPVAPPTIAFGFVSSQAMGAGGELSRASTLSMLVTMALSKRGKFCHAWRVAWRRGR